MRILYFLATPWLEEMMQENILVKYNSQGQYFPPEQMYTAHKL